MLDNLSLKAIAQKLPCDLSSPPRKLQSLEISHITLNQEFLSLKVCSLLILNAG